MISQQALDEVTAAAVERNRRRQRLEDQLAIENVFYRALRAAGEEQPATAGYRLREYIEASHKELFARYFGELS